MIKGLIKKYGQDRDSENDMYIVTIDFLKYLGVASVKDLPNYAKWSSADFIDRFLNKK